MGSLNAAAWHRPTRCRTASLGWRIAFTLYAVVSFLVLVDVLSRTGVFQFDQFLPSLGRSKTILSTHATSSEKLSRHDATSTFFADEVESAKASQGSTATNAAAIVVSKPSPNLIPLVLHFSNILGPQWPVHIYASRATWTVPNSAAFLKAMEEKRVLVKFLPAAEDDTSLGAAHVLSRPWFWEQLHPNTHILLFSNNTVICSNSQRKAEDFTAFDFVSASAGGGFGGKHREELSLWNRSLVHDILRDDQTGSLDGWYGSEMKMADMFARMLNRGARLPSQETAQDFAASLPFHHLPLGIVDPTGWDLPSLKSARSWCPEIGLV